VLFGKKGHRMVSQLSLKSIASKGWLSMAFNKNSIHWNTWKLRCYICMDWTYSCVEVV